ncbi:MAG: hypothetical protein QHJ34_14710, partial [bacterium]|nr:hypothetical protein [bacterium]
KNSPFVQLLEQVYGVTHRTIPVATPRCNGVVESFHGRIEQELYKTEPITCERELVDKTASNLLFYQVQERLSPSTPHRLLRNSTRSVLPGCVKCSPSGASAIRSWATEPQPSPSGAARTP